MSGGDGKLLAVVEHWLPRIEVAGIPSATAREIIAAAGDWSGWLRAWSDAADVHVQIATEAEARGRTVTAGEAWMRAAVCMHFGQFMAFEDLAAKDAAAARKCALYRRAAPLLVPRAELIEVPFERGSLRGYLRLPDAPGEYPLALIVPGSDSTKEEFCALERVFLDRGIATFSLDGPGQGEGRSHGPLRPDLAPALDAAMAVLSGLPGLNGRTAVVGMAFGGHLAMAAASRLAWPAAVVSINGFADLGAFCPALPEVYRDNLRFALGTDDVCGRAGDFTLAGLPGPACPALILHGGRDRIFPVDQARAQADACRGPRELRVFPEGNHVCNNIPWLYRPLVADWLGEQMRG